MLFNSFDFLFFLPIVFFLYWFVFNKFVKIQNLFIVIASYVFYGWWDRTFLLLMGFTTLCSYSFGLLIQSANKQERKKVYSVLNILINLLILGLYKYYDFFVISLLDAFESIGIKLNLSTLQLVLPVGISFYTFQALSYTIDVYKGRIIATKDIVSFFAFISFFPQLVAGPIERATNLLPQFLKKRTFNYEKAVDGCRQILWGFFKKIIVADNCATITNMIWDNYQNETGFILLLGAIFFTFQIYGDFSGYSDIAIGTARLFGIDLMRNFNFPYFSRDIAEFWRRWHISLTTWFRDYIYFPLGGSRCGKWKVCRNTMIIFLVSGFWHGANWTFIVWGLYHAFLFFPLLLLGKNRINKGVVAEGRFIPNLNEVFQILITFFLVMLGWIVFRAENVIQAWDYIYRMFETLSFDISYVPGKKALLFALLLLFVEWFQREKEHALQFSGGGYVLIRWSVYISLIVLFLFHSGKSGSFIYFQF